MNIDYELIYNELCSNNIDKDTNIYSLSYIDTNLYDFDKIYQTFHITNNINYSFYETLYFLLNDDIFYMYTLNIENYIINFKTMIINECIVPSIENISIFFNINIITIELDNIYINKNININNYFIFLYKVDNKYQPIICINKLIKKFSIHDKLIIDILTIKNINYDNVENINNIKNYNILDNIRCDIKNKINYTFLNTKKKEELCDILKNTIDNIKKFKKKELIDYILKYIDII